MSGDFGHACRFARWPSRAVPSVVARGTKTVVCIAVALSACGPTVSTSSSGAADGTGGDTTVSPTGVDDTSTTQPGVTSVSTQGTTSTTGSTDPGPDDDSSGGFLGFDCGTYAPPGVQTHCLGTPCSVFEQDCGGTSKCVPLSNGELRYDVRQCISVGPNPGLAGDVCAPGGGFDGCDFGLMCYLINPDTQEGICTPLCQGTQDEPTCDAAQTACLDEVPVCMAQCDPLAPEACGAGETCACTNAEGPCLCVQQALLPAEYLEDCGSSGECADGLACAPAENLECKGESCCTPYCDLGGPDTCLDLEGGEQCSPLFAGEGDIGICIF